MNPPSHRFYVPTLPHDGGVVRLSGNLAHRMARVLRLQPRETVALFDGSGIEIHAELLEVGKDEVIARVLEIYYPGTEPPLRLTLYQALLPADRFEWVLEKGAEIGVARFVPTLTERCIAKPPAPGAATEAKLARWRALTIAGAELSGRWAVPEVLPPQPYAEAMATLSGPAILAWEESASSLTPVLVGLREAGADELSVIVGPAGGLAATEVETARRVGAQVVTLGPRVMRAETAAIVLAALCLHGLGAMERA